MARRDVERQRGIPQRQLHTICSDHVFFRLELRGIVGFGHGVPIGFGHDDACVVGLLQIWGAVEAISMNVGQDHVFDLCRIQFQFLQAVGDQLFGAVIVARVNQDNSLRRRHRPCRLKRASNIVEVIEYFPRLGPPFRAGPRLWRA